MMSINLSNIAILNIHNANYCCIISGICKNEAINLMQNIDFTAKKSPIFLENVNIEKILTRKSKISSGEENYKSLKLKHYN